MAWRMSWVLDDVQRVEPFLRAVRVRLGEVQVHVSVHGIAGHDQPGGGNVQRTGAVGVGVAQLDRAER